MKRVLVLLTLVPIVACASAQAKAPTEKPALEVPPVPPRTVDPPLPPPPEAVAPLPATTEQPPSPTTPRNKPQTREPNREPAKPPDSKPEPPPVEPPPPAPAAASVPPLRTPDTPAASDAAARAGRDAIDRVRKTLESVDYRLLKPALQKEYENAKQFLVQSEDALKVGNYELARSLADKAERIAKQLQGR
jgi:outer membrane biosynthesis protein TonB